MKISAIESLNTLILLLELVMCFRMKHVKQSVFLACVIVLKTHTVDMKLIIVLLL